MYFIMKVIASILQNRQTAPNMGRIGKNGLMSSSFKKKKQLTIAHLIFLNLVYGLIQLHGESLVSCCYKSYTSLSFWNNIITEASSCFNATDAVTSSEEKKRKINHLFKEKGGTLLLLNNSQYHMSPKVKMFMIATGSSKQAMFQGTGLVRQRTNNSIMCLFCHLTRCCLSLTDPSFNLMLIRWLLCIDYSHSPFIYSVLVQPDIIL